MSIYVNKRRFSVWRKAVSISIRRGQMTFVAGSSLYLGEFPKLGMLPLKGREIHALEFVWFYFTSFSIQKLREKRTTEENKLTIAATLFSPTAV